MEIIYKAWDGTEFRERSACERYEHNNPPLQMWGSDGRTDKTDHALIVNLDSIRDAERFVAKCDSEGNCHDGIDGDEMGLFMWDFENDVYICLDELSVEAFRHYLKDNPI